MSSWRSAPRCEAARNVSRSSSPIASSPERILRRRTPPALSCPEATGRLKPFGRTSGRLPNAQGEGGDRPRRRSSLRGHWPGRPRSWARRRRVGLDRVAVLVRSGCRLASAGCLSARWGILLGRPGRVDLDCGARNGPTGDLRSGDRRGLRPCGIGLPRGHNARMAASDGRPPASATGASDLLRPGRVVLHLGSADRVPRPLPVCALSGPGPVAQILDLMRLAMAWAPAPPIGM